MSKLPGRSLVLVVSSVLLSTIAQASTAEKNSTKAIPPSRAASVQAVGPTRVVSTGQSVAAVSAIRSGTARMSFGQPSRWDGESGGEWGCAFCGCGKIEHYLICFPGTVFNNCYLHITKACLWVEEQ
jgi:hypothetical protein